MKIDNFYTRFGYFSIVNKFLSDKTKTSLPKAGYPHNSFMAFGTDWTKQRSNCKWRQHWSIQANYQ